MKTGRKILLLTDLFIQNALLLVVIITGIIGIGYEYFDFYTKDILGFTILGMFFLGLHQMGSGLMLGISLDDEKRKLYFVFTFVYLFVHSFIGIVLSNSGDTMLWSNYTDSYAYNTYLFLQFVIIPIIIAILYEFHCIRYFLENVEKKS